MKLSKVMIVTMATTALCGGALGYFMDNLCISLPLSIVIGAVGGIIAAKFEDYKSTTKLHTELESSYDKEKREKLKRCEELYPLVESKKYIVKICSFYIGEKYKDCSFNDMPQELVDYILSCYQTALSLCTELSRNTAYPFDPYAVFKHSDYTYAMGLVSWTRTKKCVAEIKESETYKQLVSINKGEVK